MRICRSRSWIHGKRRDRSIGIETALYQNTPGFGFRHDGPHRLALSENARLKADHGPGAYAAALFYRSVPTTASGEFAHAHRDNSQSAHTRAPAAQESAMKR